MDKVRVRQGVAQLESRLGRLHEAIRQTLEMEEFLLQSQGMLDVTISVYTPLVEYFLLLNDIDSARNALSTAKSMLTPPLDKFLGFSEAVVHARENDIVAANASLQQAKDIIDQLQVSFLNIVVNLVQAEISEVEGDFDAMAFNYQQAIEQMKHSVRLGDLGIGLPIVYSNVADAHISVGDLVAAELAIEAGSRIDPSEPNLWVSRARLQHARDMPQLALASVSYALAIWKDADDDFVMAKKARLLAAELQGIIQ
jgi:tetratricopeptide (TPR) repeat protein